LFLTVKAVIVNQRVDLNEQLIGRSGHLSCELSFENGSKIKEPS
jgi:hypothetical protein